MARIGMRHVVFAPLASHTPGSAPTYSAGLVIGRGVRGAVTEERYDGSIYGDDAVAESNNGVRGVSAEVETTELDLENAAAMGLVKKVTTGSGSSAVTTYRTTDKPSIYGGLGWVTVNVVEDQDVIEARWIYKIRMARNGADESKTKGENLEYGTHGISGDGVGLDVDGSGDLSFQDQQSFDSITDAIAWLDGLAGIT